MNMVRISKIVDHNDRSDRESTNIGILIV
jgi:hypothetical protein